MADDKEARTCDNAACNCPVPEDAKYCSASCEGGRGIVEIDCDCSHPECAGNF